jgi:hypothetical protein
MFQGAPLVSDIGETFEDDWCFSTILVIETEKEEYHINVSRNELTSVLKRLFEHLSDVNYDYGVCADSVVWLEAHGFAGIRSLESVLERLLAKSHVPTEIVSGEFDHFEINAGGQTLFAIAPVAVDLGISMLSRSTLFRISIENAANPLALIPGVHRACRLSASMAAWWRDSEESILHLVQGGANGEYPQYQRFKLGDDAIHSRAHVTVICSSDAEGLGDLLPDTASFERIECVTANEFAERHARTLESGIEIETSSFDNLCEVANRVLVESTDTSRSGAGE